MSKFVAQRGELCLLTLAGYIALTELPAYVPVGQAAWAPENDNIVGYFEGEVIYRLLSLPLWTALLKEHRQRQVNAILDSLRQRGLSGTPDPSATPVT